VPNKGRESEAIVIEVKELFGNKFSMKTAVTMSSKLKQEYFKV
jgi:hypothetical protein